MKCKKKISNSRFFLSLQNVSAVPLHLSTLFRSYRRFSFNYRRYFHFIGDSTQVIDQSTNFATSVLRKPPFHKGGSSNLLQKTETITIHRHFSEPPKQLIVCVCSYWGADDWDKLKHFC